MASYTVYIPETVQLPNWAAIMDFLLGVKLSLCVLQFWWAQWSGVKLKRHKFAEIFAPVQGTRCSMQGGK